GESFLQGVKRANRRSRRKGCQKSENAPSFSRRFDTIGSVPMARVVFTRNLQRHVCCPPIEARGTSVREVLDFVFAANPSARDYVLDEHGKLRKHMAIYVNGETIRVRIALSDPVDDSSEIYVMQALSGG